ncbi:winged helix-turn-helix transcriptional regulator [Azospirillum sp. A1-3]|uniref:winged helix-turn-helix transcriptional regulator n=1 Tax=Azospirillum sp. A1-3 TaxID=185874 RepID=UPI00336C2027
MGGRCGGPVPHSSYTTPWGTTLISRHYFPEVPPRVEYELTKRGASMLPALEGFTSWIRDNWPGIEASREAFDAEAKQAAAR